MNKTNENEWVNPLAPGYYPAGENWYVVFGEKKTCGCKLC